MDGPPAALAEVVLALVAPVVGVLLVARAAGRVVHDLLVAVVDPVPVGVEEGSDVGVGPLPPLLVRLLVAGVAKVVPALVAVSGGDRSFALDAKEALRNE